MQGPPKLGALGMTFSVMRAMQFVSLIAVIGMAGNFIAEITAIDAIPPPVLVGTMVVACLSTIYIAITYILYYDNQLPLLITTAGDSVFLIATIVVASTLGKPLNSLSCPSIKADNPRRNGTIPIFLERSGDDDVLKVDYDLWTEADRKTCYEIKAVWGLAIALCVLFSFSGIVCACLWRRLKIEQAAQPAKDEET